MDAASSLVDWRASYKPTSVKQAMHNIYGSAARHIYNGVPKSIFLDPREGWYLIEGDVIFKRHK